MDSMLEKLADYYEAEVDDFVKNITSILEPVIIVVMAVFVGLILIGVMMPIYNIGKIIK
jgi:type II secretory pathway component PulF